MSLGKMLEESCRQYGENVAIIHDDISLTYNELNRAANAIGNRLKSWGLQKGDKVALLLSNCPEFIISYFAIQKIGAVAVTLNTMSTAYELRYLIGNSEAKVLVTEAPLTKRFEEISGDVPLCRHLLVTNGLDAASPFGEIVEEGPFMLDMSEIVGDDPAVMIYTSGLTGKPLGATLTHRNLLGQSDLIRDLCGGTERDRALCVIPFFHSFGAAVNMLSAVRIGAGMVLMDRFSIDDIFSAIERNKVTYIASVPGVFLGMLFHKETERYNVRALRLCITGGAAMPAEFTPAFEKRFGVKVLEGYGLTEASPVCTFSRPDMVQKPGSIGVVIPGVEAKIVDDSGKELPAGESGELIIKGENVMKGYYRDEEATALVIRDGWLYTSDLAKIDEDGYIFLTGRKKRMIITWGFNVYPREVEIVLDMHPAVKASRVVGMSDLMRGEIVKAFVVKSEGADSDKRSIVRHCRNYLSPYKVPRKVEFVENLD
ncbi:MAG: long-chain fatty acid--CoA ligase [Syntrophales bacterium]|nr:long-chain fatty acid--CoA ligase [Syntrophales bacterium]